MSQRPLWDNSPMLVTSPSARCCSYASRFGPLSNGCEVQLSGSECLQEAVNTGQNVLFSWDRPCPPPLLPIINHSRLPVKKVHDVEPFSEPLCCWTREEYFDSSGRRAGKRWPACGGSLLRSFIFHTSLGTRSISKAQRPFPKLMSGSWLCVSRIYPLSCACVTGIELWQMRI